MSNIIVTGQTNQLIAFSGIPTPLTRIASLTDVSLSGLDTGYSLFYNAVNTTWESKPSLTLTSINGVSVSNNIQTNVTTVSLVLATYTMLGGII